MIIKAEDEIIPYKEFLNMHKKYDGKDTCFVFDCNEPAYYEGGDYRFYCGMCEKHSGLKEQYQQYVDELKKKETNTANVDEMIERKE